MTEQMTFDSLLTKEFMCFTDQPRSPEWLLLWAVTLDMFYQQYYFKDNKYD